MPTPTLVSIAQRACIRNITRIQEVGDIPYSALRPVLKQIVNPEQLRAIEVASPQIAESDAELWRAFIARDVSNWEEKIVEPKNARSWWKVYRKLVKEERKAKEEQEEQLRATLSGLDRERERNKATIVQKVIPQTFRGKAFLDGNPNPNAGGYGQPKTPTLQNAKRGKDILSAIRKQSSAVAQQRNIVGAQQPARSMLTSAKEQIRTAPVGMVKGYVRPPPLPVARQAEQRRREDVGARRVFGSPEKTSSQDRAISEALRAEQVKKEERLRALARGDKKAMSPTKIESNESTEAAPRPRASTEIHYSPSLPKVESPKVERAATPDVKPHRATLVAADETRRKLSPSPVPSPMRKRPAQPASIFMPSKKRKV